MPETPVEVGDAAILWIDLETTGINPADGVILELAAIMTDIEGNFLGSHQTVIGHERDKTLPMMEDKVLSMHLETGLLAEVWRKYCPPKEYGDTRSSTTMAEKGLREFIHRNRGGGLKGSLLIGGNSIHFDVSWLEVWMPYALKDLGFRQVNMSQFKSCYPEMAEKMAQLAVEDKGDNDWGVKHRAMADIKWSVALYRASKRLMPISYGKDYPGEELGG